MINLFPPEKNNLVDLPEDEINALLRLFTKLRQRYDLLHKIRHRLSKKRIDSLDGEAIYLELSILKAMIEEGLKDE